MTLSRLSQVAALAMLTQALLAGEGVSETWRHVLVPAGGALHVFLVSDAGRAERLPFQFELSDAYYGCVGRGDSRVTLSPDTRRIAFIRMRDLWLLDLPSLYETRVTNFNVEGGAAVAHRVYITQWSPDSAHLLYCVVLENPTRPTEVLHSPASGFFVYDVRDRSSSRVPILGEFQCWLPNGDFAVTGDSCDNSTSLCVGGGDLFLVTPPEMERRLLLSERTGADEFIHVGQVICHPGGSHLAMCFFREPGPFQIVELDLETGELRSLTEGLAGDRMVQRPSYSPTGKHLAFQEERSFPDPPPVGRTETTLRVDDHVIFTPEGWAGAHFSSWISDEAMAFAYDDSLRVLDVETGALLGTPTRLTPASE